MQLPLSPEPDKRFLAIGQSGWTFAEVNHSASAACAAILRHAPLEPGDRAGILIANPAPFILTLLALMRMRVLSVPLNTRLTAGELAWQIKNADCRLLICEPQTRALAGPLGVDVLELPNLDREAPTSQYSDFGMMRMDEDFAIIHTSGTGGRPKAAILTYGNVCQSAIASARKLDVIQGEQWLCVLPLYHVGGLSIVFRSLIYGTAIEVLPPGRFDAGEVNRILSEHPVTLVSLVPTMLQRLLDAKTRPWSPNLRLILLGGAAPSPALVARCIADKLPIATTYGLTEASSQVATARPDLVYRKPGTAGKPLMFTQVRIRDEKGDDAAAGVPGEILVKGDTVMRGYYGEPAATAAALRDGWLHTGDIGYLDEDGDLFILQRREDLIVSGGENIYPAEVEERLRRHPAVAEAVVIGLPDAAWGQSVAAALQLAPGARASAEEIEAHARAHLASYKIPRRFAFVDALPRTASGKIQRRKLRQLFNDTIPRRP
ncbi:MAG: o-succinylbenzoate--CoA ligase [Chloroflexota bacterium]|nr:o-succinylbenzoate--CoA ligase [Chloroflexota bacterium]MDE2948746.1 o-succinylbenzoate--CoA ligase [Chloroflexota bacterium]